MPAKPRLVAATLTGFVVLAAAGVVVWARGTEGPPVPRAATIAVQTVEVARTDLSTSRTLHGSLGYGTPRVVKGGRAGVVTSLPRAGQVVKRGATMFQVNDDPVPLFYGSPPLYRTLSAGVVGRDVAMVRKNLRGLGYATGLQPRPGSVVTLPAEPPPAGEPAPPPRRVTVRAGEAVLTATLIKAIKRWQSDIGLPVDGVLEVGDLVVMPESVRVESVSAVVGDNADGPLLAVTRTSKVVSSQVDAPEAASLKTGAKVTLRMPDGASAPGTIGAVASVAATPDGQQPGAPQQVAVTIQPGKAVTLDGGDVEITVTGETRSDVLAVPVTALLALREGGYAVQRPDNTLLPVETGLFAMGLVEVTGDGLTEGLAVVTTS
ncbi:efflux RND transporter periplasmic adaptor subunit [Actinoplanes sp. NPDC051470]|uniref:efflux RND transporter periplasmic adaptor subunit n=1 Tax=Actinoplanes sp. NPDC051470 TaxID=3157224 RepID=UPI003444EA81